MRGQRAVFYGLNREGALGACKRGFNVLSLVRFGLWTVGYTDLDVTLVRSEVAYVIRHRCQVHPLIASIHLRIMIIEYIQTISS